jgi:hypothetical protein
VTFAWSTARDLGERRAAADGYILDAPYFEPVNVDLCPAWLSMVSVLHGQPPLDLDRPITWVDLGCGSGVEACIVAAANPHVTVWGCDVNPTHIERARSLAARAGLDNCSFDEVSFEEIATQRELGPTEADVVVLQGVFSWVSRENQRHIVEFLRQRLAPGGPAYLMYEAATGWASMVPIAEALRLRADLDPRRSDLAFRDAARDVTALAESGAAYFPLPPREAAEFAGWESANGLYAAHEYLGANFGPLVFDEVAREMQRARCTFIGSIEILDAMSTYWAPPALADLVTSTDDIVLQQMLRDLITMRPLRRDVYRRGAVVANPVQLGKWQRSLRVVGTGKVFDPEGAVQVPIGAIALDQRFYEPLIADLQDAELDASAVQRHFPHWGLSDAVNALALLVAGGYALPAVDGWEETRARNSARALNLALIHDDLEGADHFHLAAPATGGAVRSEFVEMLTLGARWKGSDPDPANLANEALAELERQGRAIQRDDGTPVIDAEESARIVRGRVENALLRSEGILRRLGISD